MGATMLDYLRQEAAAGPADRAARDGVAWEVRDLANGMIRRLEYRTKAADAARSAVGPCGALEPYPATPAGRACPLAELFAIGVRRRRR